MKFPTLEIEKEINIFSRKYSFDFYLNSERTLGRITFSFQINKKYLDIHFFTPAKASINNTKNFFFLKEACYYDCNYTIILGLWRFMTAIYMEE